MSDEIYSAPQEALAAGTPLGISDLKVPLWSTSKNVAFEAYGPRTERGIEALVWSNLLFSQHAGVFASASGLFSSGSETIPSAVNIQGEPTGIEEQLKFNGTRVVFVGSHEKLWRIDGLTAPADVSSMTYTGRSSSAGALQATRWSMVFYNEWCIATNGVNPTQIYKTGPDFVNIVTESQYTTAEIVALLGPHVVFIGTNNNPKEVLWCAEGNPEAVDPSLYPTAGQLIMRELDGRAVCAKPLGKNTLAVYGPTSMQLLNYIGSWGVIGQSTIALVGISAVSKHSVVPVGGRNFGLQRNGVFVTDGVSFQMASYPLLGTWLERNINWDQQAKIWGRFNPADQTVRWAVPFLGSNSINGALCMNIQTGAFWLNDAQLAFNCGITPKEFGIPLIATPSGDVGFGESGRASLGGAVVRRLSTKWMDLDARQLYKYIDLIEADLRLISGPGPTVLVEARRDSTSDVFTAGPFALGDERTNWPCEDAAGEFFRFTFETTGPDDEWELGGLKFFGTKDQEDV